ncbi:ABC transporter permease [Candidatus Mycoplasma haematominutum]|uniref:ABC transporter permease n=1 Tax=Candidatus Mycoplasma haematominutum TaxID=209446 RepID=UPI0011B4A0FF|nr:phosphate ABC transporter permease [Candidatus Mycoplasma haematominutum]
MVLYTIILVFLSFGITHFSAFKSAKYLFRLKHELRQIIWWCLKILAILPSFATSFIIFEAIAPYVPYILGFTSKFEILFPFLVFFTTLFPIACLTYFHWFKSAEVRKIDSSLLSLSLTHKWREKIFPKVSKRIVFLTWALAVSKAFGESVALRWFVADDKYAKPFESFLSFFSADSHTVSSLISSFYLSDGGSTSNRAAMFVYGATLFVLAFTINWFFIRKGSTFKYRDTYLGRYKRMFKHCLLSLIEKKIRFTNISCYISRYAEHRYYGEKWNKREADREEYRKIKERAFLVLTLSLLMLILIAILMKGSYYTVFNIFRGFNTTFTAEGILVPLWNTLLLLFFAITWSFPICFFAAFFLCVYLHKWKRVKHFFGGFISGCSTVPPMLWAIFGSVVFMSYLKLGLTKTSIFGGICTLTVLNIPFLFARCFNFIEGYLKKYTGAFMTLGLHPESLLALMMESGIKRVKAFTADSVNRLNGETALLWLTTGASPNSRITIWGHGQTLTTKMMSELLSYKVNNARSVIYETMIVLLGTCIFLNSLFIYFWAKFWNQTVKKALQKVFFRSYLTLSSQNWNMRSPLFSKYA